LQRQKLKTFSTYNLKVIGEMKKILIPLLHLKKFNNNTKISNSFKIKKSFLSKVDGFFQYKKES